MTKKEALTNLRQLLQELYSTRDDASRIAEESGLTLAAIATSDKLVNYWWNILCEAHKRGKVDGIIKNTMFEWSERAAEIKTAFDAYKSATDSGDPIEPIGAAVGGSNTVVNTGGGAFIGGNVNLGGGDFVGRDKIVQGDEVKGGKIGGDKITVGNISGGTGIAIGSHAQATVNQGIAAADLAPIFAPLLQAIQSAPVDKQAEATQKAAELIAEAQKGKSADDRHMGKLIEGLVGLVPNAVSTVVSTFASPILAGIVGPVTKYVLDKIQGR